MEAPAKHTNSKVQLMHLSQSTYKFLCWEFDKYIMRLPTHMEHQNTKLQRPKHVQHFPNMLLNTVRWLTISKYGWTHDSSCSLYYDVNSTLLTMGRLQLTYGGNDQWKEDTHRTKCLLKTITIEHMWPWVYDISMQGRIQGGWWVRTPSTSVHK